MQFIINGRTFNIASSSRIAIASGFNPAFYVNDGPPCELRWESTMYRTQKGAFFLHEHSTTKFPNGKILVRDFGREYMPEAVIAWIEGNRAMVLDPIGLPLPPEA